MWVPVVTNAESLKFNIHCSSSGQRWLMVHRAKSATSSHIEQHHLYESQLALDKATSVTAALYDAQAHYFVSHRELSEVGQGVTGLLLKLATVSD